MQHGDLDRARFVQVMEGRVTDKRRAHEMERESDPILAEARPDLLGSVTAFYGDEFTEVAYFTSESEAREAETKPMPNDMAEQFKEWQSVMAVERYLDIKDPWLIKA